jgi:hypothetical protein
VNDLLVKVIFHDTTDFIDSITIDRYSNTSAVKSINSFMGGNKVFENIYYYPDGRVKTYEFIDEDNSEYLYRRQYSISGDSVFVQGEVFFQGYLAVIPDYKSDSGKIEMKKGSSIRLRIFHPSPPDCEVKIYIKDNDGTVFDVFKKSNLLTYLHTVSIRGSDVGSFKMEIWMEVFLNNSTPIQKFHRSFYYTVIE